MAIGDGNSALSSEAVSRFKRIMLKVGEVEAVELGFELSISLVESLYQFEQSFGLQTRPAANNI